jgi:ankyrin repeat protein
LVAAICGFFDIVRFLVKELGADVNQADENDGRTALITAAEQDHLDTVLFLGKELGANVKQADKIGCTPLYMAASMRHMDVVVGLVMIKELGADVDCQMHDGVTPVHVAVQHGDLIPVSCLVKELGADVNLALESGVLMSAARNNDQALIKHLVHNGAFVRAESEIGTAVELFDKAGATAEEIAYLTVRECCANPGCGGGGVKRCPVCKETRYCGMACHVTH